MARTRVAAWRLSNNNFNNRTFAAAKELANACKRRRNTRFRITFLLPQVKNVGVKKRGNVVR